MDVFQLHERLIADYADYASSFIRIADERIKARVDEEIQAGLFWPEPLLQLNPNFEPSATIPELVEAGVLHSDCDRIFRIKANENDVGSTMTLYCHQAEAIDVARKGLPYVLTTGTGSGKSLAYIVPIVDHVLRNGSGRGVQAIIVYPMNALANSQKEELAKFIDWGFDGEQLVTYERYTGQESAEERARIIANPPDILLTNYVMLELILTRIHEEHLVRAASNTRFLVFDEMHTYRGRTGADVSMLVRRCREAFSGDHLQCVGTSATMASGNDLDSDQKKIEVANVASQIFGQQVMPEHVIGETLRRTTPELDFKDNEITAALRDSVTSPATGTEFDALATDPLSAWIESTVGIRREEQTGQLARQVPCSIGGDDGLAALLASAAGVTKEVAADAIRARLRIGSQVKHEDTGAPLFAFRLHQFITRGDTAWASIGPEDTREITLKGGERYMKGDDSTRMYPLCFCRECGQAYYRVDRSTEDVNAPLLPRNRFEQTVEDDVESGYVYLSTEHPWPEGSAEPVGRLPEEWTEIHQGQVRVRPPRRKDVPEVIYLNADGTLAHGDGGISVAWLSAPFRFCLNPECRVSYGFRQRSDLGKLGILGVDGRSTATTILSLAVLMELNTTDDLDDEARKLLSFTDNRQDAALQAGHFNDFVEVSMVRSGLYQALEAAGANGCGHAELAKCVFDQLSLPLELYADGELRGPARKNAEAALRVVLEYFIYRDLERGWRASSVSWCC